MLAALLQNGVVGEAIEGWRGERGEVEESLLHNPTLSPFVALVERETALINSKVLYSEMGFRSGVCPGNT